MLAGANMSTGFWAEALQYAVCILNATPSKANNGISPAELWDGKPPWQAYLRPFRVHAYLQKPEEQRKKLQNVAKPVRYLGPARDTRQHCLWVPKSQSIAESQNVVFIEATGMSETREGVEILGEPTCGEEKSDQTMDDDHLLTNLRALESQQSQNEREGEESNPEESNPFLFPESCMGSTLQISKSNPEESNPFLFPESCKGSSLQISKSNPEESNPFLFPESCKGPTLKISFYGIT